LVVEDCPWIFHLHRVAYDLRQSRLKNFKRHLFEKNMAKYYRVDVTGTQR
jgi:hypothetical protein